MILLCRYVHIRSSKVKVTDSFYADVMFFSLFCTVSIVQVTETATSVFSLV
jgi:hypothetical protein